MSEENDIEINSNWIICCEAFISFLFGTFCCVFSIIILWGALKVCIKIKIQKLIVFKKVSKFFHKFIKKKKTNWIKTSPQSQYAIRDTFSSASKPTTYRTTRQLFSPACGCHPVDWDLLLCVDGMCSGVYKLCGIWRYFRRIQQFFFIYLKCVVARAQQFFVVWSFREFKRCGVIMLSRFKKRDLSVFWGTQHFGEKLLLMQSFLSVLQRRMWVGKKGGFVWTF